MKTNLKIISVLMLCFSTSLIIPKVAEATANLHHLSGRDSRNNSQVIKTSKQNTQDLEGTYIPPNYGGPDSHHGSGTR